MVHHNQVFGELKIIFANLIGFHTKKLCTSSYSTQEDIVFVSETFVDQRIYVNYVRIPGKKRWFGTKGLDSV